jgi:hypothetical protein
VQGKVPASLAARREELGLAGEPIPAEWEETIAACLAKEPGDRPQSAAEVWARLGGGDGHPKPPKEAKVGRHVPMPPPPASESPVAPPSKIQNQKSKIPLVSVLAAVGALVLAAVGYWGWYAPQQEAKAAAVAAAEAVSSSRAQLAHLVSGVEAALERADWADAQRRLDALDQEARSAPLSVLPEWTAAELHGRSQLNERREAARLAALRVPVSFTSEPSAEVWLAGERKGITPLAGLGLALGEHAVRLVRPGYVELTDTLTVTEGGQSAWAWRLAREQGEVELAVRAAAGSRLSYLVWADLDEAGRPAGLRPFEEGEFMAPTKVLNLPTGRHRIEVARRIHDGFTGELDHLVEIEVVAGQTRRVEADLRGAEVLVESSPAGARVEVNGTEVGVTPWRQAGVRLGSELQVKLSLAGHAPAERQLKVANYDEPLVWRATLEERNLVPLRPDFSRGPSSVELSVEATTRMQQTTTVSGKRQEPTDTTTANKFSGIMQVSQPDAQGFWTRARWDLPPKTEHYHDGTQIAFSREANHWSARFERGGHNFAGGESMAPTFMPLYPTLWLDHEILPAEEAVPGLRWEVPVAKARLLVVGSLIPAPTGTIQGHVVASGGEPGERWVEVTYDFDFKGTMQMPMATPGMRAEGQYVGTLTLLIMVDEAYVAGGRMETKLTMDLVNPTSRTAGNVELRSVIHTIMEMEASPYELRNVSARETSPPGRRTSAVTLAGGLLGRAVMQAANRAGAGDTGAASNEATVVFFRDGQMQGGMQAVRVQVGGRELASLRRNRYHVVTLPAGTHVFKPIITGVPSTEYPRTLEGGTTYYIRCFPDYGMVKVTAGMEFMDQREGPGRVRGLQPTDGSLPLPPF